MGENRPGFIREAGRKTDIFPIAVILSLLLTIFGPFFSALIYKPLHLKDLVTAASGDADIATFFMQYADFLGIWILFVLVVLIFKRNRPMISELGFRKGGRTLLGALIGLALGFLTNGFCILMSYLMGDIKLSYNSFKPGLFFAFLLVVCIQSGAEEVVDRCYLYQKLRRRYRHPAVAVIGNAAAFAALHLFNPGITAVSVIQIALVGVLFSLFVYYFDWLWAAIMMHTSWNFTQSIVFGLPNSGLVSKYSLFKLEAASARNGLFYNVNFGVEGSAGAVAVLALACIVVFLIGRKNGERRDLWAEG